MRGVKIGFERSRERFWDNESVSRSWWSCDYDVDDNNYSHLFVCKPGVVHVLNGKEQEAKKSSKGIRLVLLQVLLDLLHLGEHRSHGHCWHHELLHHLQKKIEFVPYQLVSSQVLVKHVYWLDRLGQPVASWWGCVSSSSASSELAWYSVVTLVSEEAPSRGSFLIVGGDY